MSYRIISFVRGFASVDVVVLRDGKRFEHFHFSKSKSDAAIQAELRQIIADGYNRVEKFEERQPAPAVEPEKAITVTAPAIPAPAPIPENKKKISRQEMLDALAAAGITPKNNSFLAVKSAYDKLQKGGEK